MKLLLLLLISYVSSMKPEKVVFALNCGGEVYEDSNGITYEADNYFNKGTPSDYGLQYDIELTKDEDLYQTERWADGDLIYTLPFDVDAGNYVIIFKFSEVYFSMPKEKIFDIAIGSKIVVKDLDIFDIVGKAKAHDEYVEFELKSDGTIVIKVKI